MHSKKEKNEIHGKGLTMCVSVSKICKVSIKATLASRSMMQWIFDVVSAVTGRVIWVETTRIEIFTIEIETKFINRWNRRNQVKVQCKVLVYRDCRTSKSSDNTWIIITRDSYSLTHLVPIEPGIFLLLILYRRRSHPPANTCFFMS